MEVPVIKRSTEGVIVYDDVNQIVAAGDTDIEAMENFLAAQEAYVKRFGPLKA